MITLDSLCPTPETTLPPVFSIEMPGPEAVASPVFTAASAWSAASGEIATVATAIARITTRDRPRMALSVLPVRRYVNGRPPLGHAHLLRTLDGEGVQ